jgi:hypothetical protein
MADYHAMHAKENFRALLEGIEERLPGTIPSVAALKRPYRALEKMALGESDRKCTARCITDRLRGAIDCPNTRERSSVLMVLGASTSEASMSQELQILHGDAFFFVRL